LSAQWHHDDFLFEKPANKSVRRWNEPHPPLRRNQVRILSPQGFSEDLNRADLESALEGFSETHDVFLCQRDWDRFVQWKRDRALLDWPCPPAKN